MLSGPLPVLTRRRCRFHALFDPAAPLGIGDVHELDADCAAIDFARRVGVGARDGELGKLDRLQIAQRIEIRLKVAPAAEGVPDSRLGFGRGAADSMNACCRLINVLAQETLL